MSLRLNISNSLLDIETVVQGLVWGRVCKSKETPHGCEGMLSGHLECIQILEEPEPVQTELQSKTFIATSKGPLDKILINLYALICQL